MGFASIFGEALNSSFRNNINGFLAWFFFGFYLFDQIIVNLSLKIKILILPFNSVAVFLDFSIQKCDHFFDFSDFF